MTCAPSEDSDQPGHLPSLIRVFAVHMKKAWALNYILSSQQSLWSDWADAQADLSLRWAHSHLLVLSYGGSSTIFFLLKFDFYIHLAWIKGHSIWKMNCIWKWMKLKKHVKIYIKTPIKENEQFCSGSLIHSFILQCFHFLHNHSFTTLLSWKYFKDPDYLP